MWQLSSINTLRPVSSDICSTLCTAACITVHGEKPIINIPQINHERDKQQIRNQNERADVKKAMNTTQKGQRFSHTIT
jgi:hypothetical protein